MENDTEILAFYDYGRKVQTPAGDEMDKFDNVRD